jgi:plastocyanin
MEEQMRVALLCTVVVVCTAAVLPPSWLEGLPSSDPSAGPPRPRADTADLHVEIRRSAFAPAETRVRVGETVEWINRDPLAHTVSSVDGEWGSGLLGEGDRFVHRFTAPGRYTYRCLPHRMMTGVILVTERDPTRPVIGESRDGAGGPLLVGTTVPDSGNRR